MTAHDIKPARGLLTIEQLKARCTVDPATHCWLWQGATSNGVPRIHTLDYGRAEKRVMSGPLAAWHIAYNAPPRPGCLVFRGCQHVLCLNPVHLRQARDRAEIGLHIRRLGSRIGTALESRRANILRAHAANGVRVTPPEKVLAVRAADLAMTSRAVAAMVGLGYSVTCAIRTGKTRSSVVAKSTRAAT